MNFSSFNTSGSVRAQRVRPRNTTFRHSSPRQNRTQRDLQGIPGFLSGLLAKALSLAALRPEPNSCMDRSEVDARNCTWRLHSIALLLTCASCSLIWRLSSLQGEQHHRWLKIAAKQHKTSITVQGARGTIYDSAGRTLAVSVPAVSVAAHPNRIENPEELAAVLGKELGQDPAELAALLRSDKRFVWLARGLPGGVKDNIDALGLRSISSFDEFRRFYPQQELSSSLIGTVGTDGFGLSGLEQQFNSKLRAARYELTVRRDARVRLVTAPLSSENKGGGLLRNMQFSFVSTAEAAVPGDLRNEGADVHLSIDAVVQEIVEKEFKTAAETNNAKDVFGLVMDAESGEVLALAQSRGFNPNDKISKGPASLRNLVLQNSFEPGSTMKPLVAAAAIEYGVVKTKEMMDCEHGSWRFGRHTIRDVHPIDTVSLEDVLVQSSNICMAKLGARLGKERLHEALSDLGFGEASGIEAPGEAKGILRSASRWKEIDIATHSFGQGVAVSALQMVQAYGALANGGLLIQPTLLKRDSVDAVVKRRVMRPETAKTVAGFLKGVTEGEHGTGKRAKIAGVSVYGKTGTAQKAKKDGRGYDPDNVMASFIGFVDGNEIGVDRKLVMLVIADEPNVRPRWGGTVAGPVFRRSMERILSHLLTQEQAPVQTAKVVRR